MLNSTLSDNASNRRRQVWIDGRFQFRFLLLTAGTTAAVIGVLGFLYGGVLIEQRQLMGINAVAGGIGQDPEFDAGLMAMVGTEDAVRLGLLVTFAIVAVAVLAFVSVRSTFRTVGPVVAASKMIKALARGDLHAVRHFRKGDQFSFLADDIIALRDSMRQREADTAMLMSRACDALSGAGIQSGLVDEMKAFARESAVRTRESGRKTE